MHLGGGLTGIVWLDVMIVAALVATVLEALRRWVVGPVLEIRDRLRALVADLYGREPRWSGEQPAPGVMQRIERVEAEVTGSGNGRSLRSAIDETNGIVMANAVRLQAHLEEASDKWRQVTELQEDLQEHMTEAHQANLHIVTQLDGVSETQQQILDQHK